MTSLDAAIEVEHTCRAETVCVTEVSAAQTSERFILVENTMKHLFTVVLVVLASN
jgi:hypothetical protein